MASIFGEIDSLKKLIDILKSSGINDKKSLDDIITYKNICDDKVKEAEAVARQEHHLNLTRQQEMIATHIAKRTITRASESYLWKVIQYLISGFRLFNLRIKLKRLEKKSEKIIQKKISQITGSYFKSKYLLDANYALIQGASGEQQALDQLRKLPDSYYVINNFQLRFFKPIYYQRSRQRIYSIQADHIVFGPTGVFLIETKNWSKNTIKTATSFTPIDQMKRTGFALFHHLNPKSDGFFSMLYRSKKISVKNVLLMTGQMTNERDPFVKVVNLFELISYITFHPPTLTDIEIKKVLNKLIR